MLPKSFAPGMMLASLVLLAFSAPAQAAPAHASGPGIISAYTLVTPTSLSKSRLQSRAVIPNGIPCPRVHATKGKKKLDLKMTKRVPGASTGSAFSAVRACQANLPSGLKSASIAGVKVPASLPKTFDKIAIFGDTGCAVNGETSQDCTSTASWPLAKNAHSISKEHPDLTIFTGDFFYREGPCPAGQEAKCGGSTIPVPGMPFDDSDYGWIADVFAPMAPALSAAPMLAIRGNHEACNRGGNGYFLFFDVSQLGADACAPDASNQAPKNIQPSWAVDLPISSGRTLRAVMVDSAYGNNYSLSPWVPTQHTAYEQAAKLSAKKKGRESWLITHRPMFGVDTTFETQFDPAWNNWTAVDQTAAAQGLIGNYNLMFASHIHVAQVVQIPGQPAQVVVGNGGANPDSLTGYTLPVYGPLLGNQGQQLSPDYAPYPTASYLWTTVRYGYGVLEPRQKSGQWKMTQKAYDGTTYATCSMKGKQATCG